VEVEEKKLVIGEEGLKWADHVKRMEDGKLVKRADAHEVGGTRRQGSPKLRWDNCIKRDAERVGEEWRTRAKYLKPWRQKLLDDRDAKRRTTTLCNLPLV